MTSVSINPFELSLTDPLKSASETIDRRAGFVVRWGRGIGEATPLPPWTESYEETEAALTSIASKELSIGDALKALSSTPAARHGLASAIVDHHAKTRNEPLYRFLGGTNGTEEIAVNATLDETDPAEVRDAGAAIAIAGYEAVKLKVGSTPSSDLDRVESLRDAIGPDIELRLDANGAWDQNTARSVGTTLTQYAPTYIEQPVAGIDSHVIDLLDEHGVETALDEALVTDGVTASMRSDAGVIIVKPMALGGPDIARSVAMTARGCGKKPVISDLVTGAIGRSIAAHVVASIASDEPAGLDTGSRLERDLVSDPPRVVNGRFGLPGGAGHGFDEVNIPDE